MHIIMALPGPERRAKLALRNTRHSEGVWEVWSCVPGGDVLWSGLSGDVGAVRPGGVLQGWVVCAGLACGVSWSYGGGAEWRDAERET